MVHVVGAFAMAAHARDTLWAQSFGDGAHWVTQRTQSNRSAFGSRRQAQKETLLSLGGLMIHKAVKSLCHYHAREACRQSSRRSEPWSASLFLSSVLNKTLSSQKAIVANIWPAQQQLQGERLAPSSPVATKQGIAKLAKHPPLAHITFVMTRTDGRLWKQGTEAFDPDMLHPPQTWLALVRAQSLQILHAHPVQQSTKCAYPTAEDSIPRRTRDVDRRELGSEATPSTRKPTGRVRTRQPSDNRCFAPFLLNSPERRCTYCTLELGGHSDACECNGSTVSPAAFSDVTCPASVRVRGTLLVHFAREAANTFFLGLVNQLTELSHHLALACEMGDNLAFTGFYKDLISRSSPDSVLVPLPLLVDVADLNAQLARDSRCTRTQVRETIP